MWDAVRAGMHWLDWPYFSIRLNSLELRLLEELKKVLPPQGRDILSKQVAGINRVHRSRPDRKEVNCYRRPSWDDVPKFPSAPQETKTSIVRFTVPGAGAWRVELHIVAGHFFSLTFDRSPKAIAGRRAGVVIDSVKILDDPMAPQKGEPERDVLRPFTGWLKDLAARHGLKDPTPPLAASERTRRRQRLAAALPGDYMTMVEQTDGFLVSGCSVLGLEEVYPVTLPDENYYVLADVRGEGILAVRKDSDDPSVYFVLHDGDATRKLGGSFQAALESVLAESVARA